jgi:hypothetical protein
MLRFRELLVCAVLFAIFSLCRATAAQSTAAQDTQSGNHSGRVATNPLQVALTGCLKRNSATGGYSISDQNGTIWELKSSTVNLAEQVNHSVTVTGKPLSASQQQGSSSQPSGNTQAENKPQYTLRVLSVQMLSPSCTR